MLTGYFLIFIIVIGSVGLNVWLLTDRKALKRKIEKLEENEKFKRI